MAGLLDHKQLMIVKGIGKTPDDTKSNEIDPVIFNLMTGQGGGVSLAPNGWTPQIASTKSGGVWSDSPVSDGRQLLVAPVGNVIEKMEILITGNSYLSAMKTLDSLYQMARDCRDFWQTNTQIDPVYLLWYAGCGAGQQFARLYNIDIAPDFKDSGTPTIQVSLTLEREPYWNGLPPGANPKIWTTINFFGNQYSANNSNKTSLAQGSQFDNLAYLQDFKNCLEWVDETTIRGLPNYIDVPGTSIPGDVPALAVITVNYSLGDADSYYIAVSTKPTTIVDGTTGVVYPRALNFNAPDAGLGTDTTVVADADGVRDRTNTLTRTTTTFATATDQIRLTWANGASGGNSPPIGANLTRGRYAAFLRCRQTAVTANDIKMHLTYGTTGTGNVVLPEVSPTVQAGAVTWPLTYMGIIDIPNFDRSAPNFTGLGLKFFDATAEFTINLYARRTAGASNLFVADLILMPIDEYFAQLINTQNVVLTTMLDNTGYFGHGDNRDLLVSASGTIISEDMELRGHAIQLKPGITNRIHCLAYVNATNTSRTQNQNLTVRINIIPRWSSIRDV